MALKSSKVKTVKTKASQTLFTRARIVDSALELFNDRSLKSVTTHNVAEHAGISPGNLYYHFKNREEIVRELFRQLFDGLSATFARVSEAPETYSFVDFMKLFFEYIWTYRFFFRDFSLILRADAKLAEDWRATVSSMNETMQDVAKTWVAAGQLKAFDSDDALEAFLDNIFTIIYFGAIYQEAKQDQDTKRAFKKVLSRTLEYLLPFHTPKGQQAIRLYQLELLNRRE